MPLTRDDYATLQVRAAIFHDLPRQTGREDDAARLLLSEAVTALDENARLHIRSKLVDTLQSNKSYPIRFSDQESIVSASAREYLNDTRDNDADFIQRSRTYAEALFELQGPLMSAGLLCVVACTVNGRRGLGLMKIEREEGAQLRLSGTTGARTFTFALLNNLVFTKNTKLYKAGLFAKIGPAPDSFGASASDHQFGNNMALYWLDFLGCEKERESRVETKFFFETVVHAINRAPDLTPLERHEAYEALLVEMRSRRGAVNVSQFVREHIPEGARDEVRARLRESGVAAHFDKDTADIKGAISRMVLRTENNIHVIVPQAFDQLVDVDEDSLTVRDPVVRVGRD